MEDPSLKDIFIDKWLGHAEWQWHDLSFTGDFPFYRSYFFWLIVVSVFFMVMEWVRPWREDQPKFRKDFWLDAFYMLFNFVIFGVIIFASASEVVVVAINDAIKAITGGFDLQSMNPIKEWPLWGILLFGFVVRDFTQWWIHRLLHRVEFLWQFHKVHHSVEQMGFAAHLRYHWMENVVYRTLEYLPLALLGIGLHEFFIIHIFALALGHYNHSNLRVHWRVQGFVFGTLSGMFIAFIGLGGRFSDWRAWAVVLGSTLIWTLFLGRFLKYIFNGPSNHIWHHAHDLPEERKYGVNFALSLSCWDYLFGTLYIPRDGRDIKLGFPGLKRFPKNFLTQTVHGIFIHHRAPEEGNEEEK